MYAVAHLYKLGGHKDRKRERTCNESNIAVASSADIMLYTYTYMHWIALIDLEDMVVES